MIGGPVQTFQLETAALIDALFQSITLPQGMDGWLERLQDHLQLGFAVVLLREPDSGAILSYWSAGLDHIVRRQYQDVFADQDLFLMQLPTLPQGRFHRVADVMTPAQKSHLKQSRFYQEWLKPNRVRGVMAGWRLIERGLQVQCLLSHTNDAFYAEAPLLEPVLTALSHAVPVYRHLTQQAFSSGLFGNALDALPMAAFLVNETGQVALQNRMATHLLAQESVLSVHAGELSAGIQDESRRLGSLLHQAIQSALGEVEMEGEVINVTRVGKMPLMVYVMPMRAALSSVQRGAALVLAFDPDRPVKLSSQLLGQLFDLTPAETRLAIALCQGNLLADLAVSCGVSTNTLKTQLKSLFGKTGVQRQHQLVTLLLSSPARMLGELHTIA